MKYGATSTRTLTGAFSIPVGNPEPAGSSMALGCWTPPYHWHGTESLSQTTLCCPALVTLPLNRVPFLDQPITAVLLQVLATSGCKSENCVIQSNSRSLLCPLLSPESSQRSSPESRFCSVPSTSYLARVHTSHCHLWYILTVKQVFL